MTSDKFAELAPSEWAALKVNPAAQRALRMSHVRKIVKEFDESKLGVLTLSERDGQLFIVNGLHRISALKVLKYDKPVMAVVSTGLDSKAEAQKFLGLNNSLAVSTIEKFKVEIEAGYDVATGVNRVLVSNGLTMGKDTTAVRVLEKAFIHLGPEGLDRLVKIAIKAWLGEPRFLQAPIIDALRRIIMKHNSFDNENMAKSLGTITPSTALARAVQRRDVDGGSTADALVHQFINLYNKGKRIGLIEA